MSDAPIPPVTPGSSEASQRATTLLREMADGRDEAADELLELVHGELRALAGALFRQERPGHTLQPTALVHEAWMRLVGGAQPDYANKTHFLAIAARTMRRVLVEHARRRDAAKRGGDLARVTLDETSGPMGEDPALGIDVLALHEALEKLAELDPRQARIVELRWFGGLTVPEVAEAIGIATRTVELDWTMARAWLQRELRSEQD